MKRRLGLVFTILAVAVMCVFMATGCDKKESKGELVISGGEEYVYAPQPGATTVSAAFKAALKTEDKTEDVDVTWAIISSSNGASISADGVVTITENYIAGDINGTDIVIQATSKSDSSKFATATLHVREAQRIGSFEVQMQDAVRIGDAAPIAAVNFLDQYGEPMADGIVNTDAILWEFSDENISIIKGNLIARMRVNDPTFAAVSATIGGVSVIKRFVVHNLDAFTLSDTARSDMMAADITIIKEINVDFGVARTYDINTYTYINKELTGKTNVAVDVTGMVNYTANTDYQVTLLYADGTIKQEDMRADSSGKVNVSWQASDNVTGVEVSPVLKFSLGKCSFTESEGYVKVPASTEYDGIGICGFYGEVSDSTNGVSLYDGTSECYFVAGIPDGFYDIRITKSGTGRSTVTINGASQGTNVGNPGTGGRTGTTPYTYLMPDVNIVGGTARIGLGEKDWGLAAVEIRRTTSLRERRVHVYIGGDSTVSNYYPIEVTEPGGGKYQTGWGQVFSQYVTDDIAVTNLAGGGTYAKGWYESVFPGVLQNAQPGDYFIIQAGINDRTYSSIDEMIEYLTKMIDECREKGIIVVLVTTMQTAKFWRNAAGQDITEFEKPEGGGLAAFMEAIRKLAKDKNVFLADSGAVSGEWFATIGKTFVEQNYHIFNEDTKVVDDSLHLSYAGAKNVASIVATELAKLKAAGATDAMGNTLDGLMFNPIVDHTVEYVDANGNKATATTERVQAIYERYAQ
ncbi:MAG: hypothetical protein IJW18_08380 [Lachnospiraceae bacterium]|nr:hypothetical protein [Lachnospiraceae bacterium]